MEIERKWLVKDFPHAIYEPENVHNIEQSYLSTDPEVRIRKQSSDLILDKCHPHPTYYLAVKSTGDLAREEVEVEISYYEYVDIQHMINAPPIKKLYKRYKFMNFVIEISRVDDCWYYAEVEFNSEEEAKEFVFPFPNIVIQEVTYDPRFKMKEYWKNRDDTPNYYLCGSE